MGLYASMEFDLGVLPDDVVGDGITHAQTYDFGGRDGTLSHARLTGDGSLLLDDEPEDGDFNFEFFVMNSERWFEMVATFEKGRLTKLYIAEEHPREEKLHQSRRDTLLGRIAITFNQVIARLRRPS